MGAPAQSDEPVIPASTPAEGVSSPKSDTVVGEGTPQAETAQPAPADAVQPDPTPAAPEADTPATPAPAAESGQNQVS